MKRNIFLFIVCLSLLAGLLFATDSLTGFTQVIGISTSANTVKMDSITNTVKLDATTNSVKDEAYASGRLDVDVASTTAVAITALTGRDYVEISAGPVAGEEIWVGIATAPTITTGRCVTAANPLRLKVGTGVVIKTIASGAFPMSVFQAAY